jgi:MYXO-CTERM domain-containing protein
MRAHTLRTAVRFGTSLAATATMVFLAASAHAGPSGPNTSTGAAALKYEHAKTLQTNLQTGFQGPSWAQVNVGITLDPVVNGGPIFTVDMPKGALVQATWGTDKKVVLSAVTGTQTDGLVTVHFTLSPRIDFKFDGFGLTANFSYDAVKLLDKLPGSQFDFDSKASQPFAPWGFAKVDTMLNAPDLEKATLFSMDMGELPDFISNNVVGNFGIRASTRPTFSYKTTQVLLSGVNGALTDGTSQLVVPAVDGDFMEVMAAAEGEMTVAGSLAIHPFVHVEQIGTTNLGTDLGLDAFSADYSVPTTKVPYQSALVHIPMPNVHVPAQGLDLGNGQAETSVEIANTGEKEAVMTFQSSDPAFQVTGETVTVAAKSKYQLAVKFASTSSAPASTEIKVLSSDPDSPVQTFKIGANGADVGAEHPGGASGESAKGSVGSSGCGCKMIGSTPLPSSAGLGALGLAAALLGRRRRRPE